MASWTALNVEPETDSEEDEYDDTKEIQIEDALKLYQQALKLHAQGSGSFDEAEKAYQALFASEIFSYPESLSEYERLTSQGFPENSDFNTDFSDPLLPSLAKPDSAPNTLPQVLYLSYKNYGEFLLQRLLYQISKRQQEIPALCQPYNSELRDHLEDVKRFSETGWQALELLVQALDKDEADAQLWREVARWTYSLGSKRLARYALESALILHQEDETNILGGLSLEERSLRGELVNVLKLIGDEVSVQKQLPAGKSLKRILRIPLYSIPSLMDLSTIPMSDHLSAAPPILLEAVQRSWESVGQALMDTQKTDSGGDENGLGPTCRIVLPDEGRQADQNPKTAALIAGEVLHKGRLSQSPTFSTKQSPRELVKSPTSTFAELRRKSFGTNLGGDPQRTAVEGVENTEPIEPKLSDEPSSAVNPVPSEPPRPSSKRNSESAGLQDPPEGGRSRSKRLRARAETLAEEVVDPTVLTKHYEEQLQQYVRADEWLFSVTFEMASRAGVKHNEPDLAFRSVLCEDAELPKFKRRPSPAFAALMDFKSCLASWNLNRSNLLNTGTGTGASVTLIDNGADSGFSAFLEHSKSSPKKSTSTEELIQEQDLLKLVDRINSCSFPVETALYFWIEALLKPTWNTRARSAANLKFHSKYTKYSWSNAFKDLLLNILVDQDSAIYEKLWNDFSSFNDHDSSESSLNVNLDHEEIALIEYTQTVFELHVDLYARMTGPDSKVDQPTRVTQKYRMRRWAKLANLAVSGRDLLTGFDSKATGLAIRHIWSYVVYISFVEASSRDHILLLYQDLKNLLEENGSPIYYLVNNTIMPEISASALEREMSKEKTMDFFTSIFSASSEDPVSLIENLEPVLMETLTLDGKVDGLRKSQRQEIKDSQEDEISTQEVLVAAGDEIEGHTTAAGNDQLIEFLQKATAQLRLSLWHQLKTAYERIDYPPMIFICNIRSIEIIVKELQSPGYASDSRDDRSANLIVWIRNLANLASQCLELAQGQGNALDLLDEKNMQIALKYCTEVLKFIHVFAAWEDSVRIGQVQQPPQPTGSVVPYKNAMTFLRDMQPKMWQLIYILCREAATQERTGSAATEDRLEYLRAVHNAFGLREYCRIGRKAFLKFMKSELIVLNAPEEEISQVLYDLYNLKICQNSSTLLDHGCTGDQIDRTSALEIVPFVITQASRMNIKDVLKSDLKAAAERMQAVIGTPRGSSVHQAFNRRTVLKYIQAPIIPANLLKSLRGLTELGTMPVSMDYATVARQRWFFLNGHIHLAKYRSQKRLSPDTSDDLDIAERFLKLDLDFNTESWETWYRLAQTYDAKIEEDVTWNCELINDSASDLVMMQKQAIHCYEMALSTAMRHADESFETASRLSELHADFATRIYSSSRAPFSMEPFSLEGFQRYVNRADVGTFKQRPCSPLSLQLAWKIASELYRKALLDKPDAWLNWYMLGKCRWKLFKFSTGKTISWREPVDFFIKAIQCVPEKRDSRHPEKDPILEPHYKLLSVVYKLVQQRHVLPDEGLRILENSHFARKVSRGDPEDWRRYIFEVLKVLRTADKSNWHHRMAVKAAEIIYDGSSQTDEAAQSAKEKLTQQIFTKSMIVQVWKPEFERPGRHFVYASRYVRFFVKLLEQLGDRTSLELLGKRIRKKQNEFIEHETIWKLTSHSHIRLLRNQGVVAVGLEDLCFKSNIPFDIFTLNANRLETWGHSQLSLTHPTLALLVEAIELKKLNGTLIDKTPFDDLVGDLYAKVYEQVVPGLIAKAGEEENRERMRIQHMLMDSSTPQPESSTGENTAHPGRTKTISRTEVRRRAETLVARPGLQVGRGKGAGSLLETGSAARGRCPSELKPLPSALGPQSDAENEISMQDSADNESELTEIEEEEESDQEQGQEEEEQNLMFPNLVPQNGPLSRESTVSAEKGDEMEGVVAA